MNMGGGILQLPVQVILQKEMESDVVVPFDQGGDFGGIKLAMLRPLAEIGGAILVTQLAERRIGHEPGLVLGEELFVFLRPERRGLLRRKNLFQEAQLGRHHRLIIHGIQCVQPLPLRLQRREGFLVRLARHRRQIQILRMQGKSRDGRVRIRILPRLGGASVVHRQQLNQFKADLFAPIRKRLQIGKFAHAETVFGTQTEYRHRHASPAPILDGQHHKAILHHRMLARLDFIPQQPVVAVLKTDKRLLRHVINPVLVSDRKCLARQIHRRGKIIFARRPA